MQPAPITKSELKKLLKKYDANGIVSIYLEGQPDTANTKKWQANLNQGLKKIQRAGAKNADLDKIIQSLETEILKLPLKLRHQNLIYFSDTKGKWLMGAISHWPLGNHFLLQPRPHVKPLLNMMTVYPKTGVILLSGDIIKFLSWDQGVIGDITKQEIDLYTLSWKQYQGSASVDLSRRAITHKDQYDKRIEDQERRYITDAAKRAQQLAKKLDWNQLIIIGDKKWSNLLQNHLSAPLKNMLLGNVNKILVNNSIKETTAVVTSNIDKLYNKKASQALEDLLNQSRSHGKAVFGLKKCMTALNDGRIQELFFANSRIKPGFTDNKDKCYQARPRNPESDIKTEVDIVERMLAKAYTSGVKLTPIRGAKAKLLESNDGIAALLRY